MSAHIESDPEAKVLNPTHVIAKKVQAGGPNAVTPKLLEQIERNIIVNFGGQYIEWLKQDLNTLDALLSQMVEEGEHQADCVEKFRDCAHELRGMGGMINYDMASAIGDQMYRLSAHVEDIDNAFILALSVHVDALKLVVREDLKGDGGERGQHIMERLREVYAKFQKPGNPS